MELWKSESEIYIALKYPALHYILCVRTYRDRRGGGAKEN